jgi:hypothetical protein
LSNCEEEYLTHECPLLRAPKPAATLCGFGANDIGFFKIPTDGATAPKIHVKEKLTAMIRIIEGNIRAS